MHLTSIYYIIIVYIGYSFIRDNMLYHFLALNIQQILFLIILLIMSAIFSGSETALFSLKTHDLNRIRKSGFWIDSLILDLYHELPDFLITILLGNMVVNILYYAVATMFVDTINKSFGTVGGVIFGVFSFCAVLITGEIAPKSVAAVLRVWFARIFIVPVYYIHKLLLPIRYVLSIILGFFERIINIAKNATPHTKEITALLELERNRGTINFHEAELLESVIELPDIKVGEVMTPRVDVYSISEDADIGTAIDLAKNCGHNKIPVRSSNDDEYLAWIDARDLFFACAKQCTIQDYYREFTVFSVYDRCDVILNQFVEDKDRMGLVVDERGASSGLVVVSDVLSELFGDYGDEESKPEELLVKIDENSYIIDGRLTIREWAGIFNVEIDSYRSNTLGGLITDILGRSALVGDCVSFKGIEFVVIETYKRRIKKVSANFTAVVDEMFGED